MAKIRILLADDHAVLLAGLRMLIDAESDMTVVAEATDADDVVERARRADPDVAVVDLTTPHTSGFHAIQRLRRARPRIRILVLTMHDDVAYGRLVLEAGADGYVTKRAPARELLTGVRTVFKGRRFVDGNASEFKETRGRGVRVLSAREREVFELLANGHSNREIADRLRVGVKTVETHRARLRAKLGVKTRAELVRYATAHGML